jgi:hypothetical protein
MCVRRSTAARPSKYRVRQPPITRWKNGLHRNILDAYVPFIMLIVYLGGRSAWSALRRVWDRQQHPSWPINNSGTPPSRPSVDGHTLGLSSSAIRRSIDSTFTGSTLSAAIKVQISGSDNALLSVNSWHAVFMKCPLVVPGIYMGPKPDSGEALIFSGIECCPIGHVE